MNIKKKAKAKWTFGEFIATAYQNWGAKRAAKMVQMAVIGRSVVFQKQSDYFDFLRERTEHAGNGNGFTGHIKFGRRAALLAVVLGCASFVSGGQAAEVIVGLPAVRVFVPPPPVVVVPAPGIFIYGGDYDRRRDIDEYHRRGWESRRWSHRDHDDHERRR